MIHKPMAPYQRIKSGSINGSENCVKFDSQISENLGRVNVIGVGKINSSKPYRRGDLEFTSPLAAFEYLMTLG